MIGDTPKDSGNPLEHAFRQMVPSQEVPTDLKKEVFSTIDAVSLVADILDLFTLKFMQTESVLWENIQETEYWNEEQKLFEYYQGKFEEQDKPEAGEDKMPEG